MKASARIIVVFVLLYFLLRSNAHAYIDPGSGSYFLQAVVAILAGLSLTIKVYWRRIKEFFSRKRSQSDRDG
jgi:hypothetical protein